MGVVYGDIGTSPLYALREALHQASRDGILGESEVIGIVSLLLWTLILIVTLKYVVLMLRADNRGEGGTLSLLALAQRAVGRRTPLLLGLGIAGAALFYGDAAITPAISVLSAVEGLKLVTPVLDPYVLPITLVILFALFWVQSRGTERVSAYFGPITLVWFMVLAALGLLHAFDRPLIFRAIDPSMAVRFFIEHGFGSFAVMGSVFLAVTGAEALYADMGHFGRGPIRLAWSAVVFPALALNYFGQGSLVLAHPEAAENSFFLLAPEWALLPLVLMATVATVIASQAVITGAYSLTQQAVQLGLLPRFAIRHTSESLVGQIYMPRVNWLLLAAVMTLVLLFGSSAALANAYGIAVTGAMVVDSLLAFTVFRLVWRWPLALALAVLVPLLAIEVSFFGANLLKFFHGGYVPVFLALALALAMATWVRGTSFVYKKAQHQQHHGAISDRDAGKVQVGDARARHRGLPHLRSGECSLCAPAQSQAQPCAARAEHPAECFGRHDAPSSGGRTAVDRASVGRFHPALRRLRLHGRAERAARSRAGAKARGEVRHHGDELLPEPAQLPRLPRDRNAAVAGPPLHHLEQIRHRRRELLPAAFEPRGRAW